MKNTITSLLTFGLLLFTTVVFSQEKAETVNSIDQQFNELLESSNNFKKYKVVEETKLIELQRNTRAEIADLEKEIIASKNNIDSQEEKIAQLNATLTGTTKDLQEANKAKEEIAFLGIPTNKSTYRTIMWGILLVLTITLVIFVYKFRNSHAQTKEAKKNLQEIDDEFDEYRKTALEKQQKLGRMLQDERNKSVRHLENGPT